MISSANIIDSILLMGKNYIINWVNFVQTILTDRYNNCREPIVENCEWYHYTAHAA